MKKFVYLLIFSVLLIACSQVEETAPSPDTAVSDEDYEALSETLVFAIGE